MKKFVKSLFCLTLGLTSVMLSPIEARVGIYDVGYGSKSRGMGGCAVALPQDTYVGSINPAGMVWIGNRLDAGMQFLTAPRTYTYNRPVGITPTTQTYRGRPQLLLIPEAGYNQMLDEESSIGLTIYSSGGSTFYKRNNPIAAGTGGDLSQKLGFDLRQACNAFTYSRYIAPGHSIGLSFIFILQSLNVRGLNAFNNAVLSNRAGNVTNRNIDYASGAAFRIGYFGQIWDGVTAGASYTTRSAMSRFHKYSGLIPQKGRVDTPAVASAGITWEPLDEASISFEWQRQFYNDTALWGNNFRNYRAAGGTQQSGNTDGPGFGWDNIDIYKIGVDYEWDYRLTVRGGYCLTQIPFRSDQLDVNVLTQAQGRHHLTLGLTWAVTDCSQIDIAYFHMFRTTVHGNSVLLNGGLGAISQRIYQDSISFNYGVNF